MRRKKTEKKEDLEAVQTGELNIQPIKEDESIQGTVGYDLRKAREGKKITIEKVAEDLCIKPCYLKALELSNYNDFPGQAYALGFLRTYSDFLELDTASLLTRYREERSFIKPEKMDMPIHQVQPLPYTRYFFFGLLIIALVWAFWYFLTYSRVKENPLNEIVTAEVQKKESETPQTEPVQEPASKDTQNAVDSRDVPEVVPAELKPKEKEKEKEQKKVVAEPVKEPEPVQKETRIKLVAKQDVWLEITEEDSDSFVLSRTLKKGETYDVPLQSENMYLKTGNAGGVDVFVDGKKVKALGPSGAVRSNISLSPDKLKNR